MTSFTFRAGDDFHPEFRAGDRVMVYSDTAGGWVNAEVESFDGGNMEVESDPKQVRDKTVHVTYQAKNFVCGKRLSVHSAHLRNVSPKGKTTAPTQEIDPGASLLRGRSESLIEENLRNSGSVLNPPLHGTYYIRDSAPDADTTQGNNIRFAEFIERNVVHDPHGADIDISPSAPVPSNEPLTYETIQSLMAMFDRLDADGSREITMAEAIGFWSKGFSKISAMAMFAEVDADGNGAINLDEFITFWQNVKRSGYTEAEILEELQQLMEGGAWVDWKDGRCTGFA